MDLFPSLPLMSLLKAYFLYMNIPLVEENDDETPNPPVEQTDDPFDTMLVGIHRILCRTLPMSLCRMHTHQFRTLSSRPR
jgi:hypothetical protein